MAATKAAHLLVLDLRVVHANIVEALGCQVEEVLEPHRVHVGPEHLVAQVQHQLHARTPSIVRIL